MGRRIMTVDELYSFCLKNNFLNFDSKEFGKELVVEMPANFEKSNDDTDKMTEGLNLSVEHFTTILISISRKLKNKILKIIYHHLIYALSLQILKRMKKQEN